MRLPRWLSGKESACQRRRCGFDPWVGKIPWRKKWQPTPIFLPGKSHGQRSLAGCSLWGHKRVRHDLATKGTRCCPLVQVQHLITLVPAPEPFPVYSVKVLVAQSSPTLCGPMDWSPPNSSVHGILQTRILEWVAISFSRGSSPHRDPTWVSHIAGRFFTV